MTTELFTRDGRPFVTLNETNDGTVVTQVWTYAADAAPYVGCQTGVTTICVELVNPDMADERAINTLIDAHHAAISRHGFRDAGRGGEAGSRAFLAATKGHGALWATSAA